MLIGVCVIVHMSVWPLSSTVSSESSLVSSCKVFLLSSALWRLAQPT
jgi:hypothetical protein